MTTCEWIDWCDRAGEHHVEMSNRAGTERMVVCRLHLAAAEIYGYRQLDATAPEHGPAAGPQAGAQGSDTPAAEAQAGPDDPRAEPDDAAPAARGGRRRPSGGRQRSRP